MNTEAPKPKFCRDCRFYEEGDHIGGDVCDHVAAVYFDLVRGTKERYSCSIMRSNNDLCGPAAYHFRENWEK